MKTIEERMVTAWYQKKRWVFVLVPLELLYTILIKLRIFLYRIRFFKSTHPGVPVIIVGNLTVGGTGKTPVVIELVNQLIKKGWKPGVISRGFGGKNQSFPFIVDNDATVEKSGDEALLIHRNSQAVVVIDSIKSRAAECLVEQGCNIIVTDDGLQHLALKRDYEIVIVDGERGFGNHHLLPVGPLREPLSRLDRYDFILTNGSSNILLERMASDNFIIEANELVDINTKVSFPISWLKSRKVHALAGIGNPQRFFSLLQKLGASTVNHSFPDHHEFLISDIPNDKKSLIVTEKDAVKLEKYNLQDCLYLKISTQLPEKFLIHFDDFLLNYAQNSKRVTE